MKPFHFQKFTVDQSKNVFRVGTDGVLLGAFANIENAHKILEVGTGSGVISLMLAQRNPSTNILALEINSEAVILAEENFRNSPFKNRLNVLLKDFNEFKDEEKFDLIVSNPPYFEGNSSEKDILARQQTSLTFENLIKNAVDHLSENGIFSVIIPFEDGAFFISHCGKFGLQLRRKIRIFGIKDSKPKRLILEFAFQLEFVENIDFTIEDSPRKYTAEYLELTKDFHVFKTKKHNL